MTYLIEKEVFLSHPEIWEYRIPDSEIVINQEMIDSMKLSYSPMARHYYEEARKAGYAIISDVTLTTDQGGRFEAILLSAESLRDTSDSLIIITDSTSLLGLAQSGGFTASNSLDFITLCKNGAFVGPDSFQRSEWSRSGGKGIQAFIYMALVIIIGGIAYLRSNPDVFSSVSWILIAMPLAVSFYFLRSTRRAIYGVIEMTVGLLVSYGFFNPDETANLLTLLAGIYVIIRGADNLRRGLKNGRTKEFLNKIFGPV